MSYEYPEYFLEIPDLDNVSFSLFIMVTKRMHESISVAVLKNDFRLSIRVQLSAIHGLALVGMSLTVGSLFIHSQM